MVQAALQAQRRFHGARTCRGFGGCLLLSAVALLASVAQAAPGPEAGALAQRLGGSCGLVVVLGDPQAELARQLARQGQWTLYLQLPDPADVAQARPAVAAAGWYGTRIYVESGALTRLHLADDLADAVVAPAAVPGLPEAEVRRVLRPGGLALLGRTEITKPFPAGVDDWTHHYHGPDNNPQSADRLARAPYLTQFIAEPRYAPAPQAAVAAGGRVFAALGHVAWHEREEAWLNTLIAINGFNGTLLWKQALKPGFMVDRCTMIATPDTLYLACDTVCQLLDPATGQVKDRLTLPADLLGAPGPGAPGPPCWKWMGLENGVLVALAGAEEPADPDAKWKKASHGWPWEGISQGYNQGEYVWGFGPALVALDPQTKQVLWRHVEQQPIDSRGLCLRNGRVYLCRFGQYLACLDAKTGREIWRRTAARDADVFQAIGPYRPGHGYVGGWKSTVYLKATDQALYFVGPQVNWLTALSAEDGRVLWKYPGKDLQIVLRDDGLYTIGAQNSNGDTKKLDPLTGSVLSTYALFRRACTRSTGSADGILFRATEGTVRLDLATGKPQWIAPMRPSCHVGVLIASGHLYWVPWACDCDLQMFGLIACGPAGDFAFDEAAREAERLETLAPAGAAVAPFDVAAGDWPAYRADSARSARTTSALPDQAPLRWQFAPPATSEPTAPVLAGGLAFYGGADGIVRALDAATGQVRWTAYTGGAIRYPPAIADTRALVGAGDGWVYAFEAATGRPLWRFRAAPAERKIMVHGTLLSTWPVATGVVIDQGVAYCAAGITDYDGTHVYALDAATGRLRWQNHEGGQLDRFSRRGVAAQGDLLVHDGKLYLAGGNAASPGVFDLATGKCLTPAPTATGSTAVRGRELALGPQGVSVSGQPLYSRPESPVFDPSTRWQPMTIAAGNGQLLCTQRKTDRGQAWMLVAQPRDQGPERWTVELPAAPVRWGLAVDRQGRIVVTLVDGRVMCYGPGR